MRGLQKHWHKLPLYYYPILTTYRHNKYPESQKRIHVSPWEELDHYNKLVEYKEELKEKIIEDLEKSSDGFRFFVRTSALSIYSYNALQGEFCTWAIKKLSDTRRALTKEISPKTWRDLTGQDKDRKEEETE